MYSWIDETQNLTDNILPLPTNWDSDVVIYPIVYGVGIDEDITLWIAKVKDGLTRQQEHIKQQNVKLVLYDIWEASKFLKDAAIEIQKHTNKKVYVISCDQKLPTQSTVDIKFIFNDIWKNRMPYTGGPMLFTHKKLYINLTRVCRLHRAMLLDSLIENKLFDLGFNTVSNTGWELQDYCRYNPHSKILEQKFDVLDVVDLVNTNPNNSVPIKQCKKSFVYITTETHTDSQRMFFSEKVYKPIAIGMPFMVLGNTGTLTYLKKQGFKTFSDWFNEDYDLDIKLQDRIKIIVENLKNYSKLSSADLTKIRGKMIDTCKHNQKLYKKINKQVDIDKSTLEIVA